MKSEGVCVWWWWWGCKINNEGCVTTHMWAKMRPLSLILKQMSANLNHSKIATEHYFELLVVQRNSPLHLLRCSLSVVSRLADLIVCNVTCTKLLRKTSSWIYNLLSSLCLSFPSRLSSLPRLYWKRRFEIWILFIAKNSVCFWNVPPVVSWHILSVWWLVECVAEYSLALC